MLFELAPSVYSHLTRDIQDIFQSKHSVDLQDKSFVLKQFQIQDELKSRYGVNQSRTQQKLQKSATNFRLQKSNIIASSTDLPTTNRPPVKGIGLSCVSQSKPITRSLKRDNTVEQIRYILGQIVPGQTEERRQLLRNKTKQIKSSATLRNSNSLKTQFNQRNIDIKDQILLNAKFTEDPAFDQNAYQTKQHKQKTKMFSTKQDSANYWTQKSRKMIIAERPYLKPWQINKPPTAEQLRLRYISIQNKILQQKAFLSTYRLTMSEQDKMDLMTEIYELHVKLEETKVQMK